MKLRFIFLTLFAFVALSLVAQPVFAADIKVGLKPGQKATIPMSYWCLDYGKPFPGGIDNPGDRAADDVVAVLLAAIKDGTVVSDPYGTNLAIWRVTTGEFKDYANRGTVGAEKVYSDSLAITVPAIPAGTLTLGDAVKQGKVSVEIKNFTTVADPTLPGRPFHGTADVVVTNISKENVEFVFFEGTVFPPAGGEDAQNLIAHLNPQKQPELPETGMSLEGQNLALLIVGAFGLLLAALGGWLVWRGSKTTNA